MSNTGHSGGAAHRSFRCTFGPVREVDLVWPPPEEDIDAFSVVHLDGSDTTVTLVAPSLPAAAIDAPGVDEPAIADPIPAVVVPPVRFQPRIIKPTFGDCRAAGVAPRVRSLIVPPAAPPEAPVVDEPAGEVVIVADDVIAADDAPPPPLPMSRAALATDPEISGASRSAWLAVIFAAACALLTFIEYREFVAMTSEASEAPPIPPQVSVANEPAPVARAVRPPAPKPAPAAPAPSKPAVAERITAVVPTRPIPPAPRPTPAPTAKQVAVKAPAVAPPPTLAAVTPKRAAEPTQAPPPPTLMARVETPPASTPAPTPAPLPAAAGAPSPEPLAKAAPSPTVVATPAVLDDSANDEAGIQSTLARFRTAYSRLDAGAARDVWPTVDARALERAFQSLKSQDLRFESCKMTVTGARAQAACKGRTVYVPRIGDQSPRYTSREWNFELRKADERWTIASARSL